ncbi:MAG: carboxypeptidase regulatory-like domain-containing protein [Acidobacteriia bacterium]|nr:carboxypeptidase regulatory-like domain-containing protein [Terriglobia bacterium]
MKVRKSWVIYAVFVATILTTLAVVSSHAQEAGTILGIVKDFSGGVVASAKVTVTNTDTNDSRLVTTGDDGAFRVSGLRPGHYSVRIEKDGFKTSTQPGLTLDIAAQLVVNPVLEVGASSQEVTVTGEAPVVNTTTSTLGSLVDDRKVAELPLNGRNYIDLTLIQPGIQINTSPSGGGSGSSGTWFSSNGMPPRSNNFTIDGAQIGNQYGTGPNSISGSTLGVDGIKEYKIVTSMFGAEYGMTMGSQMVIVSKGGTNQWHGDVFEYLRNNHLDARNFFEPQPANLGGHRISPFQRNNFGAAAGGPIRKDKTFFFLVYEGLRQAQQDAIQTTTLPAACHFLDTPSGPVIAGGGAITPVVTVPASFAGVSPTILRTRLTGPVTLDTTGCGTAAAGQVVNPMVTPWIGQFPFPNEPGSNSNYTFPGHSHVREDYGQLRVDQNISDSDTLFARYTLDDNLLTTPYASLSASDTGAAYPQFYSIGRSRNQYFTVGENHVFSADVLNQFRLSFSRTNFAGYPGINRVPGLNPDFDMIDTASTPGSTCSSATNPVCIWSYLPGRFNGGLAPGGGVTTLSFNTTFPTYHPQNVWTLADDVYMNHGKHGFKFGILMNNFQEPSIMQKGAYGSTNSGGTILNWMKGFTTSYLTVTPVPGFATNGVLNSPFQGNYLDKDYMFKTFGFYAGDDYRVTSRLTLNLGLRYEFNTIPHELYHRSSTIADLQGGSQTYTVGSIFNHNWTHRNFSPRVGFAWDAFGTGKTAVRGGFGIYWDIANIGSLLTQAANGVPPFAAQTQVAQTAAAYTIPFVDVNGGLTGNFTSAQFGHALQMNDPNIKNPHSLQYNLTVEQQLPFGLGLSVSYVGNRGINLFALVEGNPVVPTNLVGGKLPSNTMPTYNVTNGAAPNNCQNNALTFGAATQAFTPGAPNYPCRINPYFTSTLFITSPSNSWYNSLQVVVTKHLSHGLDFQGAYTYSRSLDTTAGQMYNTDCGNGAFGTAVGPVPFNLKLDKGPSCADVPHSMHLSVLYHLPDFKSEGVVSKMVNGWWVGNIVTAVQGFPFTPLVGQDRSFSGVITQSNQTPVSLNSASSTVTYAVTTNSSPAAGCTTTTCTYNFIPYDPSKVVTGDPNHWFNPLMFGEAQLGNIGNSPRDILRGPGVGTWNFSINKDTKLGFLGEQGSLEFRMEIFNLLNRANFGPPTNVAFSGTTAVNNLPVNTLNSSAGGNIQAPNGASANNPLGNVGQITTTSTSSRQIQLALKVVF